MTTNPQITRRRLGPGRRRGQSLVELALILPILLFLIMGVLQVAALGMVWINMQGLVQDSARRMAISSQAPPLLTDCTNDPDPTHNRYPRPRWADGDDGIIYRNCTVSGLLIPANFQQWTWAPACNNGVDCAANGLRTSDQMLTLTARYDWSNVVFMPGGLQGWMGWIVPATVTVSASEVMQY
jgi:hypothetical protein